MRFFARIKPKVELFIQKLRPWIKPKAEQLILKLKQHKPATRRAWVLTGIKLGALAFIVVIIGSVIMIGITSTPSFCRSCHIMEPYYQAWAASEHKDVPCTDCHMVPGAVGTLQAKIAGISQMVKYVTGTQGTRPWAEIEDASCLRSGCHEKRLLEGRVDFNGVHFDHKPHLADLRRGKKLRCTSCHSQVVMGEHITVTTATCILCHFKNQPAGEPIGGCRGCHEVPADTITLPGGRVYLHADVVNRGVACVSCHATITAGDGFVPQSRCFVCHNFKIDEYLPQSDFLHTKHVAEHKVECTNCHEEMTHGYESQRRVAQVDCQSCHSGMHAAEIALAEGAVAAQLGETAPRVGPMLAARVECLGCHIDVVNNDRSDTYEGSTRFGENQACINCHGPLARNLLPGWQAFFARRYGEVEQAIAASRAAPAVRARARDMLERVRHGRAVHNPTLARDLLEAAERLARGQSAVPTLPTRAAFSSSGLDCRYCHIDVPRRNLRFGSLTFNHVPHTEQSGLACDRCHENAPEVFPQGRHGQVRLQEKDCQTCHHWQTRNCTACHGDGPSGLLRFENVVFSHAPHRAAGLDCQRCHAKQELGGRMATRVALATCRACHHQQTGHCAACHQTGPTRAMTVGGRNFPHPRHAALNCGECHKLAGGAMKAKADCAGCHHARATACNLCHGQGPAQPRAWRQVQFPHSPHVAAGLECLDCHVKSGNQIRLAPACNTCHHEAGMKPACAGCHGNGPEQPVATAYRPFPHRLHIPFGIGCPDCHKAGQPEKVAMICGTCHDDAGDTQ